MAVNVGSIEELLVQPGLTVVNASTLFMCHDIADDLCIKAVEKSWRAVRLMSSVELVTRTAQGLANSGAQTLGLTIATTGQWVQSLWELFGDGRTPVTPQMRRLFVLRALLDTPDLKNLDAHAVGTVTFIEKIVRSLSEYEGETVQVGDDLTPAEFEAQRVVERYDELLSSHGYIELCSAAHKLPHMMGSSGWQHLVLDGISELDHSYFDLICAAAAHAGVTFVTRHDAGHETSASTKAQNCAEYLLDCAREAQVPVRVIETNELSFAGKLKKPWNSTELAELAQEIFHPTPGHAITPSGALRFVLPTGAYAEPQALTNIITSLIENPDHPLKARDIAVICKDPFTLTQTLSGRLAAHNIACIARESQSVGATPAGKLLASLLVLLREDQTTQDNTKPAPQYRSMATDLALNPLLGLPVYRTFELDAAWRANRLANVSTYLDDIQTALEEDAPLAASTFREMRQGHMSATAFMLGLLPAGINPQNTQELLDRKTAVALDELFAHALSLDIDLSEYTDCLLEGLRVSQTLLHLPPLALAAQKEAAVLAGNPNAVRLVTLGQAESIKAKAVIVCGLTAQNYALEAEGDAAQTFLAHKGLVPLATPVDNLRWQFMNALEAASDFFVLERPLNNDAASEERPSALFEEVIDCYRPDSTQIDELDKLTGLPKDGRLAMEPQIGEEEFSDVLSPVGALDRAWEKAPVPELLIRQASVKELLIDPQKALSPSVLEGYLRCPARWFYEQRIPQDGLDAEFGALEKGAFCHAVLCDVHTELANRGTPRIDHDFLRDRTNALALDLLVSEKFDTQVSLHKNRDEDINPRLVAVDRLEEYQLKQLRKNIYGCLLLDAELPEGYVPWLHEWSFGLEDSTIPALSFAGVKLKGRIDRIDKNDQGNLIIIDYKSRLYGTHHMPLPKDVQKDPALELAVSQDDPLEAAKALLPLHTQILMYAAALRNAPQMPAPLGAFYMGYSYPEVTGMLDPSVAIPLSSQKLTHDCLTNQVLPALTFDQLLDALEAVSYEAIHEHLFMGDIEPNPRFGSASCAFCSLAAQCPRRIQNGR